jgi:hypothetical protein
VTFDGSSHDYARILIHDNTTGISSLSDLVTKIGNSSKLGDESTSGEFGFGIYAFLAVCDSMVITTRLHDSDTVNRVELNSRMFETPDSEEFNVIEESPNISGYQLAEKKRDCWTIVKLEGFSEQAFKQLSPKSLKSQIENHFESILRRVNIKVTIVTHSKQKLVCKPFDYSRIKGGEYRKTLDELKQTRSKKYKTLDYINIYDKPVEIYLKVSKDRILNRKPVFIIKGRRITEISNVEAFRTSSKGAIYSHPNVTGYIDVTGVLQPKISRDDFKADDMAKSLFQTLVALEPEIKEFINSHLNLPSAREYKGLENVLSDTLTKLNQSTKFRRLLNGADVKDTHEDTGDDNSVKTAKIKAPKRTDAPTELTTPGTQRNTALTNEPVQGSEKAPGTGDKSISSPSGFVNIELKEVKVDILEYSTSRPANDKTSSKSKKSSDLRVVIDSENEPPTDSGNNQLRSTLIDSRIIIYKRHRMFSDRVKSNDHGVKAVSSELIFYLATEIMTQVLIMTYNERQAEITDIGTFIYEFSEVTHQFVSGLKKLEGKKLSELTAIN